MGSHGWEVQVQIWPQTQLDAGPQAASPDLSFWLPLGSSSSMLASFLGSIPSPNDQRAGREREFSFPHSSSKSSEINFDWVVGLSLITSLWSKECGNWLGLSHGAGAGCVCWGGGVGGVGQRHPAPPETCT